MSAILPSRNVNRSQPFTSTRLPSSRVPVNVHSETAALPVNEVTGVPSVCVGKGLPDILVGGSYGRLARRGRALLINSDRTFVNAIAR